MNLRLGGRLIESVGHIDYIGGSRWFGVLPPTGIVVADGA
jgi:hypothetical protein